MSMEHEIHERMRKSRSMKGRERDGMDDLTGKYKPGLVVGWSDRLIVSVLGLSFGVVAGEMKNGSWLILIIVLSTVSFVCWGVIFGWLYWLFKANHR